ncbi:T9SS type A sorting domain-containing protein [Larkinella humicola]|uniref:T9SS type A sorting domain-containing protein n=1 Tax=Larkinella humicola TaxID=2607654 RepID=A0A5N1J8C1_9BACT|nr:T9SS type A sorting domain-containing protein [Larkinella humicola]KAA9347221.1 T9SS type A sorting domain-containing protein [Larkinella humicola]
MKTLIKSLLVAFTLTTVSFSAAVADPNQPARQPKKATAFQSSLYTNVEGKLQIAVKKETGGNVVVRLTNPAGKEFFVQQFGKRQQAARLSLDVSALPDGVYQVAISNGVETTTQELTLATQQTAAVSRFVAVN